MSVHSLFLQTGIGVCCIIKQEGLKYECNERASALSAEFSLGSHVVCVGVVCRSVVTFQTYYY